MTNQVWGRNTETGAKGWFNLPEKLLDCPQDQVSVIWKDGDGIEFVVEPETGPNGETCIRIVNTHPANGNSNGCPTEAVECCENFTGTEGCKYPTKPKEGDYHLNGGENGWLEIYDGKNWLKICLPIGSLFDFTNEEGRDFTWRMVECDCDTNTFVWEDATEIHVVTINGRPTTESDPQNYSYCELPVLPEVNNASELEDVIFSVCYKDLGYQVDADTIKSWFEFNAPAGDPADAGGIVYINQDGTYETASFEYFFERACYDLPSLDNECSDYTPVAWVKDSNGCGKLVKASIPQFPQGFKTITKSIEGSFNHTFTLTNSDPSYTGDPTVPNDSGFWQEIFNDPDKMDEDYVGKVVFSKDEFCGLQTAGNKIQVRMDAIIGYRIDTDNPSNNAIAPYQWGTALRVNGNIIARNGDQYGLNTSGNNASQPDLLAGEWTTDGDDMCVEVLFILLSAETGNNNPGTVGDVLSIDMAVAGVTITPLL